MAESPNRASQDNRMSMEDAFIMSNEAFSSSPRDRAPKRKTYESPADRQNQREIADAVAEQFNCAAMALKSYSPIDFAACQSIPSPDGRAIRVPEVQFYFETKQRYILPTTFKTLELSMHKWLEGLRLSRSTGKPCYFFVRFKNQEIYYIEIDKLPKDTGFAIAMGGRMDRNDPNDVEEVLHIPMDRLTKLGNGQAEKAVAGA